MLTSVLDLLVKAQILKGDDYTCVSDITVSFGGTDKLNPRAEINFYEA